ncbi:hypothetical protein H0H87_006634, partial [Tephrocybe sp. NHM501043]
MDLKTPNDPSNAGFDNSGNKFDNESTFLPPDSIMDMDLDSIGIDMDLEYRKTVEDSDPEVDKVDTDDEDSSYNKDCVEEGSGLVLEMQVGIPLQKKGLKGAFQSELVLELFTFHLKLVSASVIGYGLPLGGLVLCAAAIEHALKIWKDNKKKDADTASGTVTLNQKKQVQHTPSFGSNEWVKMTAGYVQLTSGLKANEHWENIFVVAQADPKEE